jgi:Protein of unknown function (DUF3575)
MVTATKSQLFMKLYVTAFFLLVSSLVFSQKVTKEKEKYGDWNIIKINLSALTTGTFSFQYERAISNKISWAMGVKFRPSASLPFRSTLKSLLDTLSEGAGIDFVNNAKVGGYAITPEIRFYFGRGAMHGFYVAPFLRYERNNLNAWRYTFKTPNKTIIIDFTGNQTGIGGGLQIGSHFNLSNKVSLDLWLVGPYVFANKIDVNSVTDLSDKTDQELEDVRKDIKRYAEDYLPGHTVNVAIRKDGARMDARGTAPGIRALGLAIGYRF